MNKPLKLKLKLGNLKVESWLWLILSLRLANFRIRLYYLHPFQLLIIIYDASIHGRPTHDNADKSLIPQNTRLLVAKSIESRKEKHSVDS